MANYEKREEHSLDVIVKKIVDLDKHLAIIEETDSKVKHYVAQEEALHDIRSIVRHIEKIGKDEVKDAKKDAKDAAKLSDEEVKTVQEIEKEFAALETTLGKLADDDNKVKSYLEQKKAVFEIKKILNKAGKLDDVGEKPAE